MTTLTRSLFTSPGAMGTTNRYGRPLRAGRAGAFLVAGLAVCLLLGACADRQRLNPLDPDATAAAPRLDGLESRARDGRVELAWDLVGYSDIDAFRLYRRVLGQAFEQYPDADLDPGAAGYTDSLVQNGVTYEYRLGLVVRGEGELDLGSVRRATPGAEYGWVADRGNGLVWRLCADGRSACGAQGIFADLRGIALAGNNGGVWVSDALFAGLFRVDGAAELARFDGPLLEPGAIAVDPDGDFVWVADRRLRAVYWFSVPALEDTLPLVQVDANFRGPFSLAAADGRCWIVDRGSGRVMLYERDGRRRVEGLFEDPGPIAAGANGTAWMLVEEGRGLVRLDSRGILRQVPMPFERGVGLDVDPLSGECWVIGDGDVAAFSGAGALRRHWQDVPGGLDIAVDGRHRHVWISTAGTTWKFSFEGDNLAQLTGFSTPFDLQVSSGTGR